MNTTNAYIFVGVGMLIEGLHLLPEITGVRELWLITMGGVLMLTGGLFLATEAWTWVKPRMITPMLAWLPQANPAQGRGASAGKRAAV
jgi:predicted membrane channel-forming protein YqfA (hemolysin III family)